MESVMHRPWKISIHAKAKNFDLKFTASKILPSWEFLETRFSVFIKVHSFLLRLRSETGGGGDACSSVASQTKPTRRRSLLKSKFLSTLFDRLISSTTTTLKRRIRLNKLLRADAEDSVEKTSRGGGGRRRITNFFKSGFLRLLDKFRVKRKVRNKPPGSKIPTNLSSQNGFPRMPPRLRRWEIRYYKEELMMMIGWLVVGGYLLNSRSSLLVVMDKDIKTVLEGVNYTIILFLPAFTLLVLLIYTIVVLMKKINFTCLLEEKH